MAEPGPPKSSYAHLEGAGKLSSRIEPRVASQPPRTAPRNPKAPLPPRVSQPDKAEGSSVVSSGIVDTIEPEAIEPESVHTKVPTPSQKPPPIPSARPSKPASLLEDDEPEIPTAAVMPKDFQKALEQLQRRRDASNSVVPPPPASSSRAVDFESALAQLQRQRESGAPAPPPPPSSGRSLSAAVATDGKRLSEAPRPRAASIPSVKDLGKDLKPLVTPSSPPPSEPVPAVQPIVPTTKSITSPLVNLGLKPGSGTPLSPLRTPSPMAIVGGASLRLSMPDKTSPMAQRPSQPPPAAESSPLALPLPTPSKSVPPAPLSSRPPAGRKSLPPGGAYERAFRQWSSPSIVPVDDPSSSEPVTFQVYTAEDVATGRRPMRSIAAVPVEPKKSLGVRIGLALLGGVIVLLTAAAVIAVSTEEPKPPRASVSTASAAEPSSAPSVTPETTPSTITIGDPIDDLTDPTPVPTAASTTTTTPATTAATKPKPKSAATPTPPASLKAIAPPPNPYGN